MSQRFNRHQVVKVLVRDDVTARFQEKAILREKLTSEQRELFEIKRRREEKIKLKEKRDSYFKKIQAYEQEAQNSAETETNKAKDVTIPLEFTFQKTKSKFDLTDTLAKQNNKPTKLAVKEEDASTAPT